jgi:hypothetical protein
VAFWYISARFGVLYQEKSGNPDVPIPRFGASAYGSVICTTTYIFFSFADSSIEMEGGCSLKEMSLFNATDIKARKN